MSNDRVGWEGWAIGLIAVIGIPIGFLFMPIVGGVGGSSGARYPPINVPAPLIDPFRLTVGLVIAVLLVIAAAWIIRRTDWDTPAQEDDR